MDFGNPFDKRRYGNGISGFVTHPYFLTPGTNRSKREMIVEPLSPGIEPQFLDFPHFPTPGRFKRDSGPGRFFFGHKTPVYLVRNKYRDIPEARWKRTFGIVMPFAA